MVYLVDLNAKGGQDIARDRVEIQEKHPPRGYVRKCDCDGAGEEGQRGGVERRIGQFGGSATRQGHRQS